jgi:hypothetical protein
MISSVVVVGAAVVVVVGASVDVVVARVVVGASVVVVGGCSVVGGGASVLAAWPLPLQAAATRPPTSVSATNADRLVLVLIALSAG